jgi:hypothetical protein
MNILQAAIENLWLWTYGIILGWGASFTIVVGLIIVLFIKYFHLRKKIQMLENRLISAERDFSLYVNKERK